MSELVRLYFEGKGSISTAYKRYMWRWDEINNTSYPSHFQMGRIRINDVALPYTYVSYAKGSGQDSSFDEMAYKLVTAESTGKYDKWVIFNMYPKSPECWGYIIFDLPEAVIPASYYLKTTNDSQMNQFPTRMRLYGTNDLTANDSSSMSWVLLSDVSDFLLPSSYFTWSNTIDMNAAGVSNYYLLAPTDLARGSGLRYEVQTQDYTVIYSRVEQFSRGTYPGGTIPWSEHNVILFKFNGWITASNDRMSLAINPPNDSWKVGIRRSDSKFGSGYFAVEKGGWFNNVTIDDSSVIASSKWGGGVIFYTIPATTSSDSNEFRIIVDRLNNTVYFYLNGVLKFHQTGFSDYQDKVYLFPESSYTFMKDAYIVGCNSLQEAISYDP